MQGVPRQISRGGTALSASRADGAKKLVWDLPIRLFHWLLAGLIVFSWWSVTYDHVQWHIWSGCAILTLLIFRLLWGFFGSSTARFSSFVRGPRTVARYTRGSWHGIGHNPLGAISVLALLVALAVQVGLGLISEDEDGLYLGPLATLVSTDTSDKAREIHSFWFYVLLALVVVHLVAIVVYRMRGKYLTLPMITGKAHIGTAEAMRPGKWWVALICLAVSIGIVRWIIAGAPPFGP
jgi:cytochrome b